MAGYPRSVPNRNPDGILACRYGASLGRITAAVAGSLP